MSYLVSSVFIDEQAGGYLDAMIASGMWGEDTGEVVASLLLEGIRRARRDGLIAYIQPEAVLELQAPAPGAGRLFKCLECRDGLDNSRKCEHCGAEPEIPF